MLSFSLVAEALTGLIYHRPSGENFSSLTLCLMMGEVSPETSPKNNMIQDMINSETIKKVKVQTFSGATTQDMKDYKKPLIVKKLAHIYLHIGTNDAANLSADQVKDNIFEIARNIRNKGINCTVSSLIKKKDQYSVNMEEINNLPVLILLNKKI